MNNRQTNYILSKALVEPYYRQHAGFFLFAFFLLFGTQPSLYNALQLHYAIIISILESPVFYLFAVIVWFIYSLKTAHFVYNHLQKNAFQFLYLLNALPRRQRLRALIRLQTLLFLPVWIYFIFISIVAAREQAYTGLIYVLVAMIMLNVASVIWCNYILQQGKNFSWLRVGRILPRRWSRSLAVFLMRFMFTEQFIALLIIKCISFFVLYSLAKLEGAVYEDRLLWMIYITVLVGHSMIVYKNHHFTETRLSFYRNLPVRPFLTLLSLLAVYFLLLLPELWALKAVFINQHQLADYIWMIATGPTLLLLMHCLLYTEDMKIEGYLQLLFGIWIVSIFFSLSVNRWILPLVCVLMACGIFVTAYYRYEKNVRVEGIE